MNAINCCTRVFKNCTRLPEALRWRLSGLLLVLLIGAVLIGWVVNHTWNRLQHLQREFVAMQAENFYLGVRLRGVLDRMNGALLRFQLSKADPEEKERFQEQMQNWSALIAQARPLLATAEERDLVRQVEAAFERYLSKTAPLLETAMRAVRKDSAAAVSEQIREASDPLETLCDQLARAQKASWNAFLGASHRSLDGLWQSALVLLLLLLVFTAIFGLLAYRATVAPLRHQIAETRSVIERQERLASLGTLAAGIAHEIRNPLASLKFRLFSLRESLPPDFAANDDVVVIDDEINRLERIIKDFLQFARPAEPAMSETTVEEIMQAVRGLLSAPLNARGIRLTLESEDQLTLRADKQQLQQVIINLVQNAADSIESPGGAVTLRARQGAARLGGRSTPAVILEVSDTGKGIPPESQARLFDPFFSTKADGTGLGLAISERIVEKHGGAIQYHTRLNVGTTFQVVLPIHPSYVSQDTPD